MGERAPEGARPTETKDGDPPKEWGLCAVESDWSNPSVDQAPGIGLEFFSADLRDIIPESTRAFVVHAPTRKMDTHQRNGSLARPKGEPGRTQHAGEHRCHPAAAFDHRQTQCEEGYGKGEPMLAAHGTS